MKIQEIPYKNRKLILLLELPEDVNDIDITQFMFGPMLTYACITNAYPNAVGCLAEVQNRKQYYSPSDQWALHTAGYKFDQLILIGFLHLLPGMEDLKEQYKGVVAVVGLDLTAEQKLFYLINSKELSS